MTDTNEILFPTERELLQFSRGKLASWRRVELELLASQNDFVADALEGYQVYGARLAQKKFWRRVAISISGAIVALVAIYFVASNEKPISKTEAFETAEEIVLAVKSEDFTGLNKNEIATETTKQKLPQNHRISKIQTGNSKKEPIEDVSLINKKENLILQVNEPKIELRKFRNSIQGERIAWIQGVLFYVSIEEEAEDGRDLKLGVDASIENREKATDSLVPMLMSNTNPESKWQEEMYSSIANFVSRRNWDGLRELVEGCGAQCQKDVNINFYKAIAYYHLGEYVLAEDLFLRLKYMDLSGFEEEVTYFYALSVYEGTNPALGRKLLEEISRSKNYYAEKAAEVLTE